MDLNQVLQQLQIVLLYFCSVVKDRNLFFLIAPEKHKVYKLSSKEENCFSPCSTDTHPFPIVVRLLLWILNTEELMHSFSPKMLKSL